MANFKQYDTGTNEIQYTIMNTPNDVIKSIVAAYQAGRTVFIQIPGIGQVEFLLKDVQVFDSTVCITGYPPNASKDEVVI